MSDSKQQKKEVIMAVDVESTGNVNVLKHGLVAIGWCVGDVEGRVLEKGHVSLNTDGKEWEPRCIGQFWNKFPEQLAYFKRTAIHPKEAMEAFLKVVDKYYDPDLYNLTIITDNESFDISFLDYYISLYTNRLPLHFNTKGEYEGVSDYRVHAQYLALKECNGVFCHNKDFYMNECKEKVDPVVQHDHYPDNDAHTMYLLCLTMAKCAKKYRDIVISETQFQFWMVVLLLAVFICLIVYALGIGQFYHHHSSSVPLSSSLHTKGV